MDLSQAREEVARVVRVKDFKVDVVQVDQVVDVEDAVDVDGVVDGVAKSASLT